MNYYKDKPSRDGRHYVVSYISSKDLDFSENLKFKGFVYDEEFPHTFKEFTENPLAVSYGQLMQYPMHEDTILTSFFYLPKKFSEAGLVRSQVLASKRNHLRL